MAEDLRLEDLNSYDWIVLNSSAGKDSQTMLAHVVRLTDAQGISRDKLVVVHADLGRVEWKDTKELAAEQAKHYGLRFEVVVRKGREYRGKVLGDLLDHIEERGMWPSSTARYCTSDHKRGQIGRLHTQLAKESREAGITDRKVRILNCMGMRKQESPARAKLIAFQNDARNTNGKRHVDTWLPIHDWTEDQVWDDIRQSGIKHHEAYDLGMPRLSCCFCIFATKSALLVAGKHNPELLDQYVAVEEKINHTFRKDFPIAGIRAELQAGVEVGKVDNWNM